jgi:hypothetical protein
MIGRAVLIGGRESRGLRGWMCSTYDVPGRYDQLGAPFAVGHYLHLPGDHHRSDPMGKIIR